MIGAVVGASTGLVLDRDCDATFPASTLPPTGTTSRSSLPGEDARRDRGLAFEDPHLVRLAGGGGIEAVENEHSTTALADDEASVTRFERDRARIRVGENRGRCALPLECEARLVEVAGELGGPEAHREGDDRGDCGRGPERGGEAPLPARLERDDDLALLARGREDPAAKPRLGAGPEAATASASAVSQKEVSSSRQRSQLTRCVS